MYLDCNFQQIVSGGSDVPLRKEYITPIKKSTTSRKKTFWDQNCLFEYGQLTSLAILLLLLINTKKSRLLCYEQILRVLNL